jgi:hypothetical protein
MLFYEALQQLHDGHGLRRSAWAEVEGYLKLLPGMKHVWKIVLAPNPNAGNFIFSVEDFESDDWILVDAVNPFPVNDAPME